MGLAPARAAQISFTNLPETLENGTFNGFLGATVDGVSVNIICNDYYSTTQIPSGPWGYNISTLPALAFARFGSGDAGPQKYSAAAVLLAGLVDEVDAHAISSYQYALWTLFSPSVASYGDSASLLNAAQNAVPDASLIQRLRIYTPAAAASNQELLGLSDKPEDFVIASPEPGSIVLMGVGFLLLSVVFHRAKA